MSRYVDPPVDSDRLRLFCFPHAGGGRSLFRTWQHALGPAVSVVPVTLPGRERRSGEALLECMRDLIDDLDDDLRPLLDRPHMFFGHSMGALVAFHLASRRQTAGLPCPQALLVSGCAAPHAPLALPAVADLDDAGLVRMLTAVGGLPQQVLDWPALLATVLPVIRADLAICATSYDPAAVPVCCPIHIFGGDADPLVSDIDLVEWSRWTTASADVRSIAGGHFALAAAPDTFLHEIGPLVRRYAPTAGRPC